MSAVPVLDSLGRPAGIVSEADLLRKAADQPDLSGRTPLPHLEAWEQSTLMKELITVGPDVPAGTSP